MFLVVWWRDLLLGYDYMHGGANANELAARVAHLVARQSDAGSSAPAIQSRDRACDRPARRPSML